MKRVVFILLIVFFAMQLKAQNGNFEVKVVSTKYATVRGQLMKVSAEGIGVEDYKGNYFTFRPADIVRLKIRKRGLTVIEGLGGGTALGLGIGAGIWSLDNENNNSTRDMAMLTAFLTGAGAIGGTLTGVIAEVANTKLIFRVHQDSDRFKLGYKKLEKYVNGADTEHFASN